MERARDPDVGGAGNSVVRVRGSACGLGVEGSGWIAGPGLVVTNAHVIAGQEDTHITTSGGETLDADALQFGELAAVLDAISETTRERQDAGQLRREPAFAVTFAVN